MGWYLIAGTIPIAVFGFAFSDTIESKTRDLYLIGSMLIVLGLVLLAAEKLSKHERKLESTTLRDAIAIGFGQAAGADPGCVALGVDHHGRACSSASTARPRRGCRSCCRCRRWCSAGSTSSATRSMPSRASARCWSRPSSRSSSGYLAIAGLLRFLVNHSTIVFVVYRVALGVLVLALVGSGVIH